MLRIIFVITSLIVLSGCGKKEENKPKELIILGSVHFPTSGINSDSVYLAIKKVQPQVILMERDSVSFDSAFNRKVEYEENEDQYNSPRKQDSDLS